MEPVELSVDEQEELFCSLAKVEGTESPLWQKGAEFCLQRDIENGVKSHNISAVRHYIHTTLVSENSKIVGLDLDAFEKYVDKAISNQVLNSQDKNEIFAYIVESNIALDEKDLDKIFSNKAIHSYIKSMLENIDPVDIKLYDSTERAYTRLESYDRKQVALGDRTVDDVAKKRKIRKYFKSGAMTEAVYKGIAPHKTFTKNLPDNVAGKGTKEFYETLHDAREMAKNTNRDKLEDKQKKMIVHKKAYEKIIGKDK